MGGKLSSKIKLTSITALLCAVLLAACSEVKTIPDDKLKEVLTATILRQALIDSQNVGYKSIQTGIDSIDYHSDVLAEFGYTLEDLTYTFTQLSQRKSNPLDDILQEVVTEIDALAKLAEKKYHAFKRFDTLALEYAKDTLFVYDSLHYADEFDTLKIALVKPLKNGVYTINITHKVSTLPLMPQQLLRIYFSDTTTNKRGTASSLWLSKSDTLKVNHINIELKDKVKRDSLVFYVETRDDERNKEARRKLGRNAPKDSSLISLIEVIYTPPVVEARQRYYESLIGEDLPIYRDYFEPGYYPKRDERLSPRVALPASDSVLTPEVKQEDVIGVAQE